MARKIWFTSDTHFGHANIIKHCNRPFREVSEMDAAIISNWNARIGPEDHVWHLGDFAWKQHEAYLRRLNGVIHLVVGNHDKMSAHVEELFAKKYDYFDGRVTGDSSSPRFFLFHYPCVSWPRKQWPGTIHLYGHVHGRYDRAGEPAMDVGVDTNNFFPYSLDEVVARVTEKAKNSGAIPRQSTNENKVNATEQAPEDAKAP